MWLIRVMFLWVEYLPWSVACNIQNKVYTASILKKILSFPNDICVFDVIYVVYWIMVLVRISGFDNLVVLSSSRFYFGPDQIWIDYHSCQVLAQYYAIAITPWT